MTAEWLDHKDIDGRQWQYLDGRGKGFSVGVTEIDHEAWVRLYPGKHKTLSWNRQFSRRRDAVRGIFRALADFRKDSRIGSWQWQAATKAIEALNEAEKAAGRKTWPISRVTQVTDVFPAASQGNSEKAESQTEFQRYAQAFLETVARELDIDIPDGGLRVTWAKGQPGIDSEGTSAP